MALKRSDLLILSDRRLTEARALFTAKLYAGAFYLAGYSAEFALKACIAKNVRKFDFPDKKLALASHVHDLMKLVGVAGLDGTLATARESNNALDLNWQTAKDWTEASRYERRISRAQARDMIAAIEADPDGVLWWLKNYS